MGKRGPARTPTPLLKLVGSNRVAEREHKEPKPTKAKPTSSINMSEAERHVFDQVFDFVSGMGLHAVTDGNALARYAKNVVLYNTLAAFCDKNGETYMQYEYTKEGEKRPKQMKRFPQSMQRNEVEMMLLRLEREFGLTPAARASLQVDVEPEKLDLEAKYLG